MKKILIAFAILSVFLVSANASNEKADKPEAPAAKINMTGKVVDALTGEALAGAVVEIEGTQISVFTDLDGQFNISELNAGTYALKVKYISYEDKKVESVKVDVQNNTLDISLQSK